MRRRRALLAAAALPLLLAGCTGGDDGAPPATAAEPTAVETDLAPCPEQTDEPATGNELPALQLDCIGGGTLDLTRAPGTPTVLNLWASWCGPCRAELPIVQELADTAGDRLRVIGVDSKDGLPQGTSFAADAGLTFPSAFDGDGELMTGLGINALPHTLFLAADGSLAHVEVGEVTSLEEFEQLVAEHLGVQL